MMDKLHRGAALVLLYALTPPPKRTERGLSQSTENAILLAGAVTIAVAVITAVGAYVNGRLPK